MQVERPFRAPKLGTPIFFRPKKSVEIVSYVYVTYPGFTGNVFLHKENKTVVNEKKRRRLLSNIEMEITIIMAVNSTHIHIVSAFGNQSVQAKRFSKFENIIHFILVAEL